MCRSDIRIQTASPWRIQGSWEFQGEFSKVPDKDWNKTSTSNTLLQQNESDMQCFRFNKGTNLSIKLGFISRLYIVKSRKGILFNKMSPTRPVRIQIKIGLYVTHWVLEWFNSRHSNEVHIVCRSPLCCLSRSLPWWTRPQFSTSKLKVRRPCRDSSLLCLLQVLTAKQLLSHLITMNEVYWTSHLLLSSLFNLMPYLTIRNC